MGPLLIWAEYNVEYGFIIYNNIIKLISQDSVSLYFFITTFLSLFLFYKSAISLSINPFESLVILAGTYFPLLYLIQIRQGLAIALAIFAVCIFHKDKKIFKFTILSFIALSIHISVFMFIIFGFLFLLLKNLLGNILGCLFLFIISIILSEFILYFFRNFGFEKFEYYVYNYDESSDLLSLTYVKYYFLLVFSIIISRFNDRNNLKFLLYFLILTVGFKIGLSEISVLAGRFMSIFSIMEIFIIPVLMRNLNISFFSRFMVILSYAIFSSYYLLFIKYTHIIELY